jgi:hypothetical protein
MAHLINEVVEGFGVADPQAAQERAGGANPAPTWVDLLPGILTALARPESLPAAVALLREMAEAADRAQ